MKNSFSLLLSLCFILTVPVFSPNSAAKVVFAKNRNFELEPMFKDKNWDMSAELGVLLTSGNTNSTSFLAKANASHEWREWRFKYDFNALLKRDDVFDAEKGKEVFRTSAEQYIFKLQSDYEFTATNSAFGFFSHTDDRFASYVDYTILVVGYSFRALKNKKMLLDLNLGPGYAVGRKSDRKTEQGFVIRGSAAYKWDITPYARFVQNLSIETAGFNTRTITDSSFMTRISGSMQMKVGFTATHNTKVQSSQNKLSTETSVTLVMNI
jgi:putative salt-induced outer membrane protein